MLVTTGFLVVVVAATIEVQGATANVTVTWVIPVDKTISISYPTGLVASRFSPSGSTFSNLAADSQTDATASWRVTNDGNVAISLTAAFIGSMPSGVTLYKIATASSGGSPSGEQHWWTNANATVSQGIHSGTLDPASYWDYFAWSSGSGVAGGSASQTLTCTSS
jgi:hypothetical protein